MISAAVMVERSMRNPEEIKTAVGRRLAHLSDSQAQFTGEDENSLLHGKEIARLLVRLSQEVFKIDVMFWKLWYISILNAYGLLLVFSNCGGGGGDIRLPVYGKIIYLMFNSASDLKVHKLSLLKNIFKGWYLFN